MLSVSPLVSVIMPVFNAEDYVVESMDSILNQSYSNIEFIIIDDGSTDSTVEKIGLLNDTRIVLKRNGQNIGLAASLNIAIKSASGTYLARMDADDISHPKRIEKQVDLLMRSPEISLLGTGLKYFNASNYKASFPLDHESCKVKLLFNVCMGHPSLMIKRSVFNDENNFYDPTLHQYSEDYDLYSRLVDKCKFANMKEILLNYRTFGESVKGLAEAKRKLNSQAVRKRMLTKMGVAENELNMCVHTMASDLTILNSKSDFFRIGEWFQYLEKVNREFGYFDNKMLRTQLTKQFFDVAYFNAGLRIKLRDMSQFPFFQQQVSSPFDRVKYLIKKATASF